MITPAVLAIPAAMELAAVPVATVAMVIHTVARGVSQIAMLLQSAESTRSLRTRHAHSTLAVVNLDLWVAIS
jgi:hypothetical protein